MDEMAENGEEPSRAKAFIATHRKRKDGRPIDIDSMERVEKMTEMLDELPNSIEQSRGNGAWEDDIYSKVMGPEPYGRVRGLGLGPTPKSLWGYIHQSEMPEENNTPTNEKVHRLEEELKAMEQRHVDEISTMKESQVRLESQISLLLSSFGMRVPQQPMTFRSNEILNEQVQSTSETHRPMHRSIA
ncbi:uncharacterized protein LOC126671596 [Mercurialis annua]|uniref:uncharacterized protein LOC126671596 n=1 Tax=Mercurialis annua TaxID=3986 RepID=UPI0021606DD3|nr:uncharacterized protein LOC126671596 [Mercurialis annua]